MKKISVIAILIFILTILIVPLVNAQETCIVGDSNNDSIIDVNDATYIQRYVAKINKTVDSDFLLRADVDNSEKINIKDVTYIQKYLSKQITSFIRKDYIKNTEITSAFTEPTTFATDEEGWITKIYKP